MSIILLKYDLSGEVAFSQDQRLFYDLCIWVITGVLPYTMVGITLGPLNHSRWLTLGQRILCLYIKSVSPCKKLRILAEFVIKGYAAIWFRVRLYPKGTDAPRHYFRWMRVLKTFSEDIQVTVLPILENGLYWFHSENLLLSALSDENIKIRRHAVNQILKIRHDKDLQNAIENKQKRIKKSKKRTYKKQRVFVKPIINYDAENYLEVISWDTQALYEPPYTKILDDSQISAFVQESLQLHVPSHSVQTERMIRDIDKVASKSTSEEKRDGMVQFLLADRKAKPSLQIKSDVIS